MSASAIQKLEHRVRSNRRKGKEKLVQKIFLSKFEGLKLASVQRQTKESENVMKLSNFTYVACHQSTKFTVLPFNFRKIHFGYFQLFIQLEVKMGRGWDKNRERERDTFWGKKKKLICGCLRIEKRKRREKKIENFFIGFSIKFRLLCAHLIDQGKENG